MSKSAIRCKAPECEECPEWIFTFADLVMLMMGFFVILWVTKPSPAKQPDQKQSVLNLEMLAAIRKAFAYTPDPKSTDPVDEYMLMQKLRDLDPLKGKGLGGETLKRRDGVKGTDPEVEKIRKGPEVGIGGKILFDEGSEQLRPEMAKVLDDVISRVRGYRNIVMIKGHCATDDLPDSGSPQAVMDLSLHRAQAVATYLGKHGIHPDTLRVEGCSVYEPVKQQAYTPDVRATNRRVEIEVMTALVDDYKDPGGNATTQRAGTAPETQPGNALEQPSALPSK